MTQCRPADLADPDDQIFIVSGWSSSQRMSRDIPLVQMTDWAALWHPVVRAVLARPRSQTLVAHGALRQGFICFEHSAIGNPPLVNYVYVAQPYRRQGIASGLFAAADIDPASRFEYACRTKMSWELLEQHRKAPLAGYNPFRARFAEEERTRP